VLLGGGLWPLQVCPRWKVRVVLHRIIARVLSNGSAGWLQEAGGSKDATAHEGTHRKPKSGPSYSGLPFHSVRSLWSAINEL
jgi:hypothetical protein